MPGLFSRLKGKDGSKKKKNGFNDLSDQLPAKPKWEDAWTRKTVEPEEIHELIRCCTEELKARGAHHPQRPNINMMRLEANRCLVLQLLTCPSSYYPSDQRPIRALCAPSSDTTSTRIRYAAMP